MAQGSAPRTRCSTKYASDVQSAPLPLLPAPPLPPWPWREKSEPLAAWYSSTLLTGGPASFHSARSTMKAARSMILIGSKRPFGVSVVVKKWPCAKGESLHTGIALFHAGAPHLVGRGHHLGVDWSRMSVIIGGGLVGPPRSADLGVDGR